MEASWTVDQVMQDTERFLHGLGLPRMIRPDGLGTEYAFPTNVRQLTSLQLGELQLRLTAWFTYLLDVQGKEEAELGAVSAVFKIRLGVRVHELRATEGGRPPAQDVLEALAVAEQGTDLRQLQQNIIARGVRVRRLEAQAKIYAEQLARLSREQSRRESEMRAPGA